MKKYKIKEMIDARKLDVSKLAPTYQENIELMETASQGWKKEVHDVRKMDNDMFDVVKKTDAYTDKPAAKKTTDKKPDGKYKWTLKVDPSDIKESIAQQDGAAHANLIRFEKLHTEDLKYFYDELVAASYPDETTVAEQKKDMKYVVDEFKKDSAKKPDQKKEDPKPPHKTGDYGWYNDAGGKKFWATITKVGTYSSEHNSFEYFIKNEDPKEKRKSIDSRAFNKQSKPKSITIKVYPKRDAGPEIDKAINDIVDKPIFFKSDKDNWIQGKIYDAFPAHKKDYSSWRIEYQGPGGKSKWGLPLSSDAISSDEMIKFMNGETVKDLTMTKPKAKIIQDYNEAIKEIDACREEAKTERVEKLKAETKPPKKTTSTVYKDKTVSWASGVAKIVKTEKPDSPDIAQKVKAIVEKAEKDIHKIIFGDAARSSATQKEIEKAFSIKK